MRLRNNTSTDIALLCTVGVCWTSLPNHRCGRWIIAISRAYRLRTPLSLLDLFCKRSVYEPLIDCSRIFESKRHHLSTIKSQIGDKSSVLLVRKMHQDLITAGVRVHERQELVLGHWVHQLIDYGKWETVFGADFVQIRVVYTCPSLSIPTSTGFDTHVGYKASRPISLEFICFFL